MLLPDYPVDLYVSGQLLKKQVAKYEKIVSPPLPSGGAFKYTFTVKDSNNPERTKQYVVTGVTAGANLTADFRDFELVASL